MENLSHFISTFTLELTNQQQTVLRFLFVKANPNQRSVITKLENFYKFNNLSRYQLRQILVRLQNVVKSDCNLLQLFKNTPFPSQTAYNSVRFSEIVERSNTVTIQELEKENNRLIKELAKYKALHPSL